MHIKRRVIDAELIKIIQYPQIKTLSNKKVVSYSKGIIRIPDYRNTNKSLFDTSLYYVEMIAPPYTLPLWRYFFQLCKSDPSLEICFIKLYGYVYKPTRDKIAFYVCEACERKRRGDIPTPTDKTRSPLTSLFNSYFEGEEYIREKYPYIDNEKNKVRAYFYKDTTPKSILYYKDLSQNIRLLTFQDLSPLINPLHKENLKDKPIFYQLLDTLADEVSPLYREKGRGHIIKELLSGSTYKAQKHESPKAQKPKE